MRGGWCFCCWVVMFLLVLLHVLLLSIWVQGLGSMSPVAASYGSNGPAFCGLDGGDSGSAATRSVECFGSDAPAVYGAPRRLPLLGLTAGDGFFCGLTVATRQPYCWGSNLYVAQGVPSLRAPGITYSSICAGDNHLCALRGHKESNFTIPAMAVDCWGYNMTGSFVQGASLASITAGSLFACGLFADNATVTCWGDETGSRVISQLPKSTAFVSITAGGYHVCGITARNATLCWGSISSSAPSELVSIVGGKFQACGLFPANRTPHCWGNTDDVPGETVAPTKLQFVVLVAGDYYTCGVVFGFLLRPFCWGTHYPTVPVTQAINPATSPPSTTHRSNVPIQTLAIVGELAAAVLMIGLILMTAYLWVKYKLAQNTPLIITTTTTNEKEPLSPPPPLPLPLLIKQEEPNTRRAESFKLQELELATASFSHDNEIGKSNYTYVYKGTLSDGRVVAIKRAMINEWPSFETDLNEFRNQIDLLSRLNHTHLLNLLGFCQESGERLLVYEFMANGTLHEQLHNLGWVRRVTIAVQSARALEYLHGYACPPVIHRDIKSSNILLDKEWNARVSDFGVSMLDPPFNNSFSLSSELLATGYLDPEYYHLHYLTTKSDVYSFGVLLLEILSGRNPIDNMGYGTEDEGGSIVEWAMPLIKSSGDITPLLDPRLEPPLSTEAMQRIAKIACRCVKRRGKDRPGMDKVTTELERALTILMGTPSNEQLILPSEVVLGSSRLHHNTSHKALYKSLESASTEYCRYPSSITFPSVQSSQRVQSSLSDEDRNRDSKKSSNNKMLEIIPASPNNTNY